MVIKLVIISTHRAFLVKLYQEQYRLFNAVFFYLLRILNFRRIFFGMILIDVGVVREMKQENSNMILLAIFQILSLGLFVVKINSAFLPKATFFLVSLFSAASIMSWMHDQLE